MENNPFNLDQINKLVQDIEDIKNNVPEINFNELDEYIAKGKKIENIILVTPHEKLKDVNEVKTKHGWLKIQYSRYCPNNQAYLMDIPKFPGNLIPKFKAPTD